MILRKKVKTVNVNPFENADDFALINVFKALLGEMFKVNMSDVQVLIKPKSVTMYGVYKHRKNKPNQIILYRSGRVKTYTNEWLFSVFIHEFIHYYQFNHVQGYKRKRGVMHDKQFYDMLHEALENAKKEGLLQHGEYTKGYYQYLKTTVQDSRTLIHSSY